MLSGLLEHHQNHDIVKDVSQKGRDGITKRAEDVKGGKKENGE